MRSQPEKQTITIYIYITQYLKKQGNMQAQFDSG